MRIADFADGIVKLFPPFRWDDTTTTAWTTAIVSECGVFSPDVRKRAYDDLVRKHKGATPQVSVVLNACLEAKRWADAEDRKTTLPLEPDRRPADKRIWDYSDSRTKAVNDALRTPIAKRALKEGWHLAFRDFVRVHGYPPQKPDEVSSCVRGTREFNEALRDLQGRLARQKKPEVTMATMGTEDTWVPLGAGLDQSLMRLAMSMLKKRDEVARIIEGRE